MFAGAGLVLGYLAEHLDNVVTNLNPFGSSFYFAGVSIIFSWLAALLLHGANLCLHRIAVSASDAAALLSSSSAQSTQAQHDDANAASAPGSGFNLLPQYGSMSQYPEPASDGMYYGMPVAQPPPMYAAAYQDRGHGSGHPSVPSYNTPHPSNQG